ncbi:MAG: gliding motility protein GldM, partial [Chitinophagaceae bacterium]|nr:gliding motility protein GldM [Chitinophagaceae bacterium]
MINLMYLVLTAMLALNVSSEILHAFEVINQSITSSNNAINEKNEELYKGFDEQENQAGQKERVKPFNDKAKMAKSQAAELIAYLEEWKNRVVDEAGGREEDGEIKRKDNIDASTLLLVERKGGDTLKQKLLDAREKFLSLVNPAEKARIAKDLPMKISEAEKNDNNPQGDWSTAYFHNMPTMAVVTLLSKFQNDVRNSEAVIINQLADEAGDIQVKFDAFEAIAVPTTSYALEGQKIEAKILLAAYNKSIDPTIAITGGGGAIKEIKDGVGQYEATASGIGLKTVKGRVAIDLGGRKEEKDFEFQYMVGSTGASIQLDKMNVFYIGVPNPITVSAAGYSLQDVFVDIQGADVQQDNEAGLGHYIVKVNKPGEIDANIMAKTENGTKKAGGMKVRVKYIPDPIAKIGGKTQGAMPSNIFKAQRGILAVLENFDFDTRFVVTSYEFSMLPKRGELLGPYKVNGPYLDKDRNVNDLRNRAKPGDRVYIEEIRAKGPDGRIRALNSITLLLL